MKNELKSEIGWKKEGKQSFIVFWVRLRWEIEVEWIFLVVSFLAPWISLFQFFSSRNCEALSMIFWSSEFLIILLHFLFHESHSSGISTRPTAKTLFLLLLPSLFFSLLVGQRQSRTRKKNKFSILLIFHSPLNRNTLCFY